jgi:hypothetical protein
VDDPRFSIPFGSNLGSPDVIGNTERLPGTILGEGVRSFGAGGLE